MKKILLSFTFILAAVALLAVPAAARGKVSTKSSNRSVASAVQQGLDRVSTSTGTTGGTIQYASERCEEAPKIHFNGKDWMLHCPALEPFVEDGVESATNTYYLDVPDPLHPYAAFIEILWHSDWLETRRDEIVATLTDPDFGVGEALYTRNQDVIWVWYTSPNEEKNYQSLVIDKISDQGDMFIAVPVPAKIDGDESKMQSWREKLIREAINLPFPKPYKGTKKRS